MIYIAYLVLLIFEMRKLCCSTGYIFLGKLNVDSNRESKKKIWIRIQIRNFFFKLNRKKIQVESF